jgi:hypothetical protein
MTAAPKSEAVLHVLSRQINPSFFTQLASGGRFRRLALLDTTAR